MEKMEKKEYNPEIFVEEQDDGQIYIFATVTRKPKSGGKSYKFTIGRCKLRFVSNSRYTLHSLYVADSYRRRGVARKLVEQALEYAFDRKACVSLFVGWDNHPAINLYETVGFVLVRSYPRLKYYEYMTAGGIYTAEFDFDWRGFLYLSESGRNVLRWWGLTRKIFPDILSVIAQRMTVRRL